MSSVSEVVKVNYKFYQKKPEGGSGKWMTDFELFPGDISADDLQNKISEFKARTQSGYRLNITVESIERI